MAFKRVASASSKRKFKAAANSSHNLPVSPGLLERRFDVEAPNRVFAGGITLERVPIKWNHLIDKDSLKIKELEHVPIEKVEQLFRDMP